MQYPKCIVKLDFWYAPCEGARKTVGEQSKSRLYPLFTKVVLVSLEEPRFES